MMGHLNSFSASGGGEFEQNFSKNSNARGLPGDGMLKLRFDWYITGWSLWENRFDFRRSLVSSLPSPRRTGTRF